MGVRPGAARAIGRAWPVLKLTVFATAVMGAAGIWSLAAERFWAEVAAAGSARLATIAHLEPTSDKRGRSTSSDRRTGSLGASFAPVGLGLWLSVPSPDPVRATAVRTSVPAAAGVKIWIGGQDGRGRRGRDDDGDYGSPWSRDGERGTYRTLCVRLCDGYYWPISFSTTRDHFWRDSKTCERSCSGNARLFVHQNPGQSPEEMVDTRGRRYKELSVAYKYRTSYDPDCACKPHPWEEASLTRHRAYAAAEETRKRGGRYKVGAAESAPASIVVHRAASDAPAWQAVKAKAQSSGAARGSEQKRSGKQAKAAGASPDAAARASQPPSIAPKPPGLAGTGRGEGSAGMAPAPVPAPAPVRVHGPISVGPRPASVAPASYYIRRPDAGSATQSMSDR